jgi:DNA repair protein RadC
VRRLVAGPRAVREALDDEGRRVAMVFIDRERRRPLREIEARAQVLGIRVEVEEASTLEALAQGIKHQGVIALSSDYPYLSMDDLLAQAAATPLLVALDTKHRLIAVSTVSVGTADHTFMGPREIFRDALLAGATAIFLAHNHPSGDATPSADDRQITRRLAQAGSVLGVDVLDHLIIGDPDWTSLARKGVL